MLRRSRGGGSTILVGHRQSRSQGRVALLDPYGTDQTAPRQLFLISSKAVRTFPWARAACISANKDTLFRIHGTNQPEHIGMAVSSGCIRMINRRDRSLQAVQNGFDRRGHPAARPHPHRTECRPFGRTVTAPEFHRRADPHSWLRCDGSGLSRNRRAGHQ
jgi:hypothetical protein